MADGWADIGTVDVCLSSGMEICVRGTGSERKSIEFESSAQSSSSSSSSLLNITEVGGTVFGELLREAEGLREEEAAVAG